jgi:hypothetical protein
MISGSMHHAFESPQTKAHANCMGFSDYSGSSAFSFPLHEDFFHEAEC